MLRFSKSEPSVSPTSLPKPSQLSRAAILRPVGALAALAVASQLAAGSITVVAGDTLYSLALAHNTTVDEIAESNSIKNPDLILIGQKIAVPQAASTPLPPVGVQPATSVDYTVRTGDTIYRVARTHGVSVRALVLANGLSNKRVISVGQVLRIPGAQSSTTPVAAPATTPTPAAPVAAPPTTAPPATAPPATAPPATAPPTTAPPVAAPPATTPPRTNGPAAATPAGPATTLAPVLQPGVTTIYAVRPGDTLASIARRFGTTAQALMEANNLAATDLYVGQYLLVRG